MEEQHHTGRRTNADALPRLGAGYFSGVTPSAGKKTETPIWTGLSPADLDSQPLSLKLPSRCISEPCPTAPAMDGVPEDDETRALDLN